MLVTTGRFSTSPARLLGLHITRSCRSNTYSASEPGTTPHVGRYVFQSYSLRVPPPRLLSPMPLQTHPPSTSVSVAYRHTSSSGWWQRPTPRPRRRTVSLGPETIVCPRSWQRWLLSAALAHFLLLFIAHTAWLGLTQHKAPQRELVTTRSHLFCRPCSLCGGTRELKLPHWRTFPYKSSRHGVVLEILRAHARVHRTQLRGESPSAGAGVGLDILCHARG